MFVGMVNEPNDPELLVTVSGTLPVLPATSVVTPTPPKKSFAAVGGEK